MSPILQGSLGNLPPLYILAGNGEVLRDEIIYLAHKAACPADYPTRLGVLQDCTRQKENAEKFTAPTNVRIFSPLNPWTLIRAFQVRLQVFDGMCHVLTVFMFTKSVRTFPILFEWSLIFLAELGEIRVSLHWRLHQA